MCMACCYTLLCLVLSFFDTLAGLTKNLKKGSSEFLNKTKPSEGIVLFGSLVQKRGRVECCIQTKCFTSAQRMSPYLIFNVPSIPKVTSERNTKVINSEVGGWDDGAVSNINAKHYRVMTVTVGDRYVLGFPPTARFLRSQNLCRLYKGLRMRL